MLKNRKICFRLTARRILGVILAVVSMLNVFIVGAVFMAAAPASSPTIILTISSPPLTSTATHTLTQTPSFMMVPSETSTNSPTPCIP